MANYKDFSAYNDAAEQVRPTARIQLIQRILNAASLISSLVSGVPLKWASSYKSFQVLKYSENSNPEDVTPNNAITAVDSIIHEAESQLRASKDDMTTLTTELSKLDTRGTLNYWDITNSELTSEFKIYTYFLIATPGAGTPNIKYIGIVFPMDGAPEGFCMSADQWNSIDLSNSRKASIDFQHDKPSTAWISIPNFMGSGNVFSQVIFALGSNVEQAESYHTDFLMLEWTSTNSTTYFYASTAANRSANYFLAIPWNTEPRYSTIPMSSVGAASTGAAWRPGLNLKCRVTPNSFLGLPDPTQIINILDNM